ncbi:CesT family type III secretion system chaperone, partial [Acinetobacter baumannii]
LDGLPRDDKTKLKLYETLLEGCMLGGQMAGGGVGVAVKEELILIHCTIDMAHAVPAALRVFAPLYVETVERWRKLV